MKVDRGDETFGEGDRLKRGECGEEVEMRRGGECCRDRRGVWQLVGENEFWCEGELCHHLPKG